MRLVERNGDNGVISSSGIRRSVNLSLLVGARVGDYLLVHAGFAIERIKPKEARITLKAFSDLSGKKMGGA
jgi:hydrogenase expression/formation protein HypC